MLQYHHMTKFLLLVGCFALWSCVSEEERAASMYQYETTMRNQCVHKLGFQTGTQNYMNCRIFYDEYLESIGYSTSGMSFSKAQTIQTRIDELNNQCARYWGQSGIAGQHLWSCVQTFGNKQIEKTKHEKELKEQEEMLTRSIAAGQKEANEASKLQDRIDAERERVARETGKNPKKIRCTTSKKSNGYIKVKCK